VSRRRVALVGFGQVAEHGHWPAYRRSPDFDVVAVVERTAERREQARRLDPHLHVAPAIDDLDPDSIDVVDICTPPALHAAPMIAAIARGWHVICEKPLLVDRAAFGVVRAAAATGGRAVLPVHNWKYAPIVRRAASLVGDGAIGRVSSVAIRTLRVRDCAVADPDRPNWRRDPAIAGGGILMDHGWHAVYLALDWFRERPVRVTGSVHRPSPQAAEDEAHVTIAFPSGEAEVLLSWNADVRRNEIVLTGDRGTLTIADDRLVGSGIDERFQPLSAGSHHADWFEALLPDFRRAIDEPSRAWVMFEEAAACLDIILQAYAAAANLAFSAASSGRR